MLSRFYETNEGLFCKYNSCSPLKGLVAFFNLIAINKSVNIFPIFMDVGSISEVRQVKYMQ